MKQSIIALIIVTAAILLGWFFLFRDDTSTTSEAEAGTGTSTSTNVNEYLSTIDTTGFSSTQLAVLKILREEYAKYPTEFDETVLTYTEGFEESWCADFISWMFNEADSPFIHQDTGYWRIPGVETLQEYYEQYNAYYDVGDYTPQFGDVAFYFGETPDGSSTEHVAIVLAVEGNNVVTIGGNETDAGIIQIRADELKDGVKGLSGFGASDL